MTVAHTCLSHHVSSVLPACSIPMLPTHPHTQQPPLPGSFSLYSPGLPFLSRFRLLKLYHPRAALRCHLACETLPCSGRSELSPLASVFSLLCTSAISSSFVGQLLMPNCPGGCEPAESGDFCPFIPLLCTCQNGIVAGRTPHGSM